MCGCERGPHGGSAVFDKSYKYYNPYVFSTMHEFIAIITRYEDFAISIANISKYLRTSGRRSGPDLYGPNLFVCPARFGRAGQGLVVGSARLSRAGSGL